MRTYYLSSERKQTKQVEQKEVTITEADLEKGKGTKKRKKLLRNLYNKVSLLFTYFFHH